MDNQEIPRVTPARIGELMANISYQFWLVPGTTTTVCVALLDGKFTLAQGYSACVDPRLFNQAKGEELAKTDAAAKAADRLWELEGYALYRRLKDEPEQIARIAHEVNRAYCQALGDNSQPAWKDAPAWQQASAHAGVALHLNGDHGPEASHSSWMAQKLAEGWKYGETKNPEAKEHPCMVAFADLPKEQQAKDFIFRGVVHAFKKGTN